MPQNPLQTLSATPTQSKLNITAAVVVKAGPGRLGKLIVIEPGTTGGVLTINDLATTSGGAAGNEIFSVGFAGLTAGQVIDFGNWPCKTGIAVTAVPSAGNPQYTLSFT